MFIRMLREGPGMFTRPDEDQSAQGDGELNDEHLTEVSGGRTPIHRIMRDNSEAVELTDDELEDIAGGLMAEVEEPSVTNHEPTPE